MSPPIGVARAGVLGSRVGEEGDVSIPDTQVYQQSDNYWFFDEGSGSLASDSVGQLDADFNAVSWGSGDGSGDTYALTNGADEFADLGSQSQSDLAHIMNDGVGSIGGWVRPENVSDNQHLFGTVIRDSDFAFGITTDTPYFLMGDGSDGTGAIDINPSEDLLNPDEWVSVVVTLDGSTARLYIDGDEVTTDSIDGSVSGDLEENVTFAAEAINNQRYYDGGLSNWWRSPTAISQSNVQEWHDATEPLFGDSEGWDSEADQKLIHRWVLDDVNGTVEDSIGTADGTNNGVASVSGDWAGGSAGEGDGSSAYIETTTLGSFGASMGSDFAIALSLKTTTAQGRQLGVRSSGNAQSLIVQTSTNDEVGILIRSENDSGDYNQVFSSTTVTDDTPRRVVLNKTGNTESDIDIWLNQSQETTNPGGQDSFDDTAVSNFTEELTLFAYNDQGSIGSYEGGIIDDICIYNDSLTQSEIESYQSPWESGSGGGQSTLYFTDGGNGSALYGSNQPQAVYDSGADTTYITYQGDSIDPYATAYDHASDEWAPNTHVGDNPLTDDSHGAPALAVDDDGYIHIFYGCHNDPIQHARSTNPNDVTEWDDLGSMNDDATYTNTAVIGGDIYLFYRRRNSSNHSYVYVTSSDGGDTWSSETEAIDFSNRSIYPGNIWIDGDDIHLTWGDAPEPGLERYDVYYARFDTADGTLYAADGTDVGSTITQTEGDDHCLVEDSGSDYAILPAVRLDQSGNPHIMWAEGTDTSDWDYNYSTWDSGSWTGPETVTTVSTREELNFHVDSVSDIVAYFGVADGTYSDIQRWEYDGTSWSLDETVIEGGSYGNDINGPITPVPYSDDLHVLFREDAGDFTTDVRVFAYGSDGFVERQV